MNIDSLMIRDANHFKLCKMMFQMLNCNLLWVMNLSGNSLKMLATDNAILEHYLDKKYYLHDPNINTKPSKNDSPWQITLGTDSDTFSKSGFLYDLYKMFNIDEFVSIEKNVELERYCFRFFTRNNRFVFMNRLLNDVSIIKICLNSMIEKFKADLHKQAGMGMGELYDVGR